MVGLWYWIENARRLLDWTFDCVELSMAPFYWFLMPKQPLFNHVPVLGILWAAIPSLCPLLMPVRGLVGRGWAFCDLEVSSSLP
jgi:hypothetical protein